MNKETLTDARGHWQYGPLTPGSYSAIFSAVTATGSRETQAFQDFTVADSEQTTLVTSLSGPPQPGEGILAGTVTTSTGAPATNAQITLTSSAESSPPPVAVAADGTFRAVLLAGSYGIEIRRDLGDADATEPETLKSTATVSAGETSTASYSLPPVPSLSVPPGTVAQNTAQDLDYLNKERERWGLPAHVVANADWSRACAAHDAYTAANPNAIAEEVSPHTELAEKAGYSPGGRWGGEHSVLAGAGWREEANPWEDAPIHLNQLFAPDILQMGIDESHGGTCATTWPGLGPSGGAAGTVLTYPGDGTSGLPPAENAEEWPFVPGDSVGIPQGTTAGRELFVYEEQSSLPGSCGGFCFSRAPTIVAASLTGPAGPVEVRSVDGSNGTVGGYLMGAIIIPVQSLVPFTTYTARVVLAPSTFPEAPEVSHQWSFTTGANPPPPPTVEPPAIGVRVARPRLSHLRVSPRRFRPAKDRRDKQHGASVTYDDSAAAVTGLTVLRASVGRRIGHSCVKPSRATLHHRRCTRLLRILTLIHRDRPGRNALFLAGRVRGRPLRPGGYRLQAQARASRFAGPPVSTAFEVVG